MRTASRLPLLLSCSLALPAALSLTVALPSLTPLGAVAAAKGKLKAAAGKAAPAAGVVHLPVTTFKLGNGLTVLVHEDHSVPLVAVNLWYHVGSREEKAGRTGFAHLFEHLMFQGSAHVGDDQHLRLVSEAGGSANATTSEDRTNFFEVVPSNFLERALYLESDRMGFFVDALTQEKLDNQRDVVRNERRQSYENRPYGMVEFAVHENIYPAGHPYHFTTIGTHEDLERATLDEVKAFFRTYYTPGNASLSLSGDVTVAQARALAEKYFGPLPSQPVPAHAEAQPVALDKDKRVRLEDRVSLERLYLVWPSPKAFGPGDAELDLLASVLGGKSGRLYKWLVYDLQVAQSVEVMQASSDLGSTFYIVVTAKPGHSAPEMEKLVAAELKKLLGSAPVAAAGTTPAVAPVAASAPLTAAELSRAQNLWEASFVYGLQDFGGLADRVNQYFYSLGQADSFDRDRSRYLSATVEGVSKTAAEVLGGHHLTLMVVPHKEPAPAPAATSTAPTAAAATAPSPANGNAGQPTAPFKEGTPTSKPAGAPATSGKESR